MLHFCRLVEEADFRSTAELFAKKGDENTLDNFIPNTESDFLEYAELISHKLRPYEVCDICFTRVFYVAFALKELWSMYFLYYRKAITILDC